HGKVAQRNPPNCCRQWTTQSDREAKQNSVRGETPSAGRGFFHTLSLGALSVQISCSIVLLAALAISSFVSPASAAQFDGSWNMVLTTTNGHCGVINIGVAVSGGHISATSGNFVMHKIFLDGRIAVSGVTKINGVAGPRQAVGIGRFTKVKGKGTWNGTGPSGICSGVWSAIRA